MSNAVEEISFDSHVARFYLKCARRVHIEDFDDALEALEKYAVEPSEQSRERLKAAYADLERKALKYRGYNAAAEYRRTLAHVMGLVLHGTNSVLMSDAFGFAETAWLVERAAGKRSAFNDPAQIALLQELKVHNQTFASLF